MTADGEAEEDSVRETYRYLDEDFNVLYPEDDKQPMLIGMHYRDALPDIEMFVEEIAGTDNEAFIETVGPKESGVIKALALGKRFKQFDRFYEAYEKNYQFSENVGLFFDAYEKFQMHQECLAHLHLPSLIEYDKPLWKRCNEFITYIRTQCRTRAFKKRIYDRQYNAVRGYESAHDYVERLFAVYSRLLVIRIDLGYKKVFSSETDLSKARSDLEKLLNNRRSNKLFSKMVGHIWKLEYGVQKGFHFHCVFFFNGAEVQKDSYYATMIGKYWVDNITQSTGTMYNCNMQKNKYRYCGIGMVNHHDDEKRNHLLRAIRYLTKKEQFLRMKLLSRRRVFGRGEMPALRENGVGRPRG